MLRNLAVQITYQGTDFNGYQIQPGEPRTVQAELQTVLERLLRHAPRISCAGRTDAGVHAYAQVVNFQTAKDFPVDRLAPALNSMLPGDVRAIQAWEMPADFSARFSALARHYRYILRPHESTRNPHLRNSIWQCRYDLDFERLKQSWLSLQGQHNFQAFCKSGSYRDSYDISVHWCHAWQWQGFWVLEIIAQSFLYNMVRNLVGTMVDIARGKLPPEQLQLALDRGERHLSGSTAPPQGLYLYHVLYPAALGLELLQPNLHNWPVPLADPSLQPDTL